MYTTKTSYNQTTTGYITYSGYITTVIIKGLPMGAEQAYMGNPLFEMGVDL